MVVVFADGTVLGGGTVGAEAIGARVLEAESGRTEASMADTEQLEGAIGLAWIVDLPVTVLWTLWAMHRHAHQRAALAGLLLLALPGVLIGVELAVHVGIWALTGRPVLMTAYDFVGVPLSGLWLVVGLPLLLVVRLDPVETRAPTALTVAHTVLWAVTTLVALRFAVGV